jgi:rod shape-determining protein MreD
VSRRPVLPPLAEKALFAGLGVAAVYAALVPLGPGSGLVPPDLPYCLVVAWVIRRPATAPLAIVLLLGLFGDLMLSRPPGLGALGLVLASEVFRVRGRFLHGLPFPVEWVAATAAFATMLAAMQLALTVTLADPPGLAASLRYLLATALAYPLVVAGLVVCLHLRAPLAVRVGAPLGRLP